MYVCSIIYLGFITDEDYMWYAGQAIKYNLYFVSIVARHKKPSHTDAIVARIDVQHPLENHQFEAFELKLWVKYITR